MACFASCFALIFPPACSTHHGLCSLLCHRDRQLETLQSVFRNTNKNKRCSSHTWGSTEVRTCSQGANAFALWVLNTTCLHIQSKSIVEIGIHVEKYLHNDVRHTQTGEQSQITSSCMKSSQQVRITFFWQQQVPPVTV